MSKTEKFTVVDRRKFKAEEEEQENPVTDEAAPEAPVEADGSDSEEQLADEGRWLEDGEAAEEELEESPEDLPPGPTDEESRDQQDAYEASAQRIEDLLRAQNPGAGAEPPISFDNLVQQFYVTAMIQMGAGTQEGQRPRVDIVGARTTIDLLGVLADKTRGNLTSSEDRLLQSVLFEVRMAFLELASMVGAQGVQPPPPGKR